MKFNKGDIVEIIDSQDIPGMKQLIGSMQTVDRYYTHTDNEEWYILTDYTYIWSERWLKLVNSFKLDENEIMALLKE